jgi:VanZ family protein
LDLKQLRSKWRVGLSAYAPLVIWIGLILFFSGSRGSVAETSRFFGPLLEYLFPSLTAEDLLFYYGYFRKIIHFAVYAVLGFLALRAVSYTSNGKPSWSAVLIALLICLGVAVTDEYVQSFDPSRTGTPNDVAIDMAGAITMVLGIYLLRSRRAAHSTA